MTYRLVKGRHCEELKQSARRNLLRISILDCFGNLPMTKLMLN